MEMKTVLRQLLSWADLSGTENLQLKEALSADRDAEVVDAESATVENEEMIVGGKYVPSEPEPAKSMLPRTEEQAADAVEIDPMEVEAVKFAAQKWNMSTGQAAKEIATGIKSGKFTKPMIKAAFKKAVTGG